MPGAKVLIRSESIFPLGAATVCPRCMVLIFDTMLPRQRLHVAAAENEPLFLMLNALLNHWKMYCFQPHLAPRLGMVGVDARSQHEVLPASAPPAPHPCGVELSVESWTDDEITLVGGRPFELLELYRYKADAAVSEYDPRRVWEVFDGQDESRYMLARVAWMPLPTLARAEMSCAAHPGASEHRLRDAVAERFRTWGTCVRMGGFERFPGQLDQILRDLGPCPPATQPDAVCLWLAALLNPLPALGVAPEIRGHVLCRRGWSARQEALIRGLQASLQNVGNRAMWRGYQSGNAPPREAIDVCRVS